MVNFRFHLVSLTAVFLALAAGITIGAGVVNRASVALLERQLSNVEANRTRTNAENDRLATDLSRWGEFSKQAGDRMVEARLDGVNVFLVGTSGADRTAMEGFRSTLTVAGAQVGGTVWFTGKWALTNQEDARQLATMLDLPVSARPEEARTAALSAVAARWGSGGGGQLVTALRDNAFLDFDAPPTPVAPLSELPAPGSLLVVLSGDGADVATADLAVPLVERLTFAGTRLIAVQTTRPPAEKPEAKDELPPEFVVALREESTIASRISTIDNIDDYRGKVAALLAMQDLRSGRTGHYGFLRGARIVPEAIP